MKIDYRIKNYPVYACACVLLALLLTACPLPYQYNPEGYPGQATGADPTTPDITASPLVVYAESSGRTGSLGDSGSATTSSDTEITFSSETLGAVIYYTTDNSTPDPRSPNTRKYQPGSPYRLRIESPTPDRASESVTIRATAIGPNMKPSLVTQATVAVQYPQAAAPEFDLEPGAYNSNQTLSLTNATPGATIYYRIAEGNDAPPRPVPGQADTERYSGPITLQGPNNVYTIAAIAVADQLIPSQTASASYSIAYEVCAQPSFNPPGGAYFNDIAVTLSSHETSTIWFTLDGSTPIVGSSPYCGNGTQIGLPGSNAAEEGEVVLTAIATEDGYIDSGLATATYTFRAAAPTAAASIPPYIAASNTYCNTFALTLSTSTAGAIMYYTTDGSDPRTSATRGYADGPQVLQINGTTRVRAITTKNGYQNSVEFDRTYTLQAATPTFSLAGGDYFDNITITFSCATSDAQMYISDGIQTWYGILSGESRTFICPRTVNLYAYAYRNGFLESQETNIQYRLNEMPTLITIAAPGNLTPPTVLPAGAPSPEYWEGFFPTGWRYGSYAYVVWDPDHQNWGSFAVAAYDDSWNIVREWLIPENRYIDGIMMNHSNGNIEIAGQSGISELYWLDYRPPFN